jgi:hypothetical protein
MAYPCPPVPTPFSPFHLTDDDGTAYHVRTGLTIERLTANYSASSGEAVNVPNSGVEGPSMFKRAGVYYVLVGQGCCACRGGSNVVVYASAAGPMGWVPVPVPVPVHRWGGGAFTRL